MYNEVSLENIIGESFSQYAGAVIQSRALVDVRDCVKPSARQVYYCMYTDKFTYDKPFKKTLKAIGSSMRLYIHGDMSCEGIIMRSGQPFAMRYPLVEVEGSYGNLTETGNWAAPRYTASRLSELTNYLIKETDKYTIDEWIDNYDDTEEYPRMLSSLGFYNIVNGTNGISVGIASSIPQFNIVDVNKALVKLLKNPEAEYKEIACFPDFATGGIIVNKDEVYESLEKGQGKGCVIQAKISYDKKDHCLIVEELPYSVYTNTICNEISKLVEDDGSIGIININDLTGENVCIKIYLSKKTNPEVVKDILYQKTSLQKTYSINMTMLEDGRYPRVFGWKNALLSHLKHEKKVYINMFSHKLDELKYRLKIVDGIITAIDKIDEVINAIKQSESTSAANEALCLLLNIDSDQAKAILDIKLSRLARLEIDKYTEEKQNLEKEIERISNILNSEDLLKEEMIARFKEVAKKFGDERRTQVIQKEVKKEKKIAGKSVAAPEPIVITFNPIGYLQRVPVAQYRNNDFPHFKTTTTDNILLFTSAGRFFRIAASSVKECGPKDKGTAIGSIIKLEPQEKVIQVLSNEFNEKRPYVFFAMENGVVKKAEKTVYMGDTRNMKGQVAVKTDSTVVGIFESNGDDCLLETNAGFRIRFDAEEVRASGKNSTGVKGISLQDGDFVVKCKIVSKDTVTKTLRQKRGGKGKKIE